MKVINTNSFVSKKTIAYLMLLLLFSVVIIAHSIKTSAQQDDNTTLSNERTAEFEVFRQFDNWIEQYLSENFASESEFIQSGESFAAQRHRMFAQLIKTNPQAAIEKAVSAEVQKQLPLSVVKFLEKNISANGDFNVYAIDTLSSLEGHENNHQIEREVVIGTSKYKAFVYGRKAGMTTKLNIPLQGIILDDLMAVDENFVNKIERASFAARNDIETARLDENTVVAEIGGKLHYFSNQAEFDKSVKSLTDWEMKIAPAQTDNLSSWTEGAKEFLLIRVDFPDNPGVPIDRFGQPLTESAAQNLIDNLVNEFYVSNSYGKTSLRATVTPVVRMPQPQTVYTRDNLLSLLIDARNAARNAGFETDNYHLDMVAFSQSTILDFAGISPIGNKGALLNGSFTFKTTAHELGHELGLLHANLWRTFDGTITGNGTVVEYGDDFDMIGRGATQATHFNANYKRTLDWLTEENVQTITRPGVYRVYAFDTPTLMQQSIRTLKIKRDETKDFWIEFRQLLNGFPNLMDGALVHWDLPVNGRRQTQLLDMMPSTVSLNDSSLLIGKTFADEASGVTITVLGKGNSTPESLDIKIEFNFSVINGAPFDFDGDNKTDIAVFRPSNSVWYLQQTTAGYNGVAFGANNDLITPADFDGDGKTDIAVFRPSNGVWYLQQSTLGFTGIAFGANGDIPMPADYDGDGKDDLAVFRPSNGVWYIRQSTNGFIGVAFGANGDVPAAADFDGDGRADVAVFRPSNGVWYINRSQLGFVGVAFGASGDKPSPADYDGDGKTDIAVFRQSNGVWYLQQSTAGFNGIAFGTNGDAPVAADYDGDGRADIGLFRPSNGVWYLQRSTQGFTGIAFGAGGDKPAPNSFIP